MRSRSFCCFLITPFLTFAQSSLPPIIDTIAGGHPFHRADESLPANLPLVEVRALAVDPQGNLFIADTGRGLIYKIAGGKASVFASGVAAHGLAFDSSGNLFAADRNRHRIVRYNSSGQMTVFAGTGTAGYSGDGGLANQAMLNAPSGVAVDERGNVYICEFGSHTVRRISPNGIIQTLMGTGRSGFADDNVLAVGQPLWGPEDIALDKAGNIYVSDINASRVRIIDTSGITRTFAGGNTTSELGDGGPANQSYIGRPFALAVDAQGAVYITTGSYLRVRRVSGGRIETFAGNGKGGFSGDGGPARNATLALPQAVAVDNSGNVYIGDHRRVRRVNPSGIIETVAGYGLRDGFGDGYAAFDAYLNEPWGVIADKQGSLYVADRGNHRIRKIDTKGVITTIAGDGLCVTRGDGGLATEASITWPVGLALDGNGNLYIAEQGWAEGPDSGYNRVRKVSPDGRISTVAGGKSGPLGVPPSRLALDTRIGLIRDVAVDSQANLYISELYNVIWKVTPDGRIAIYAGQLDRSGFAGDGGPATQALLNNPDGLAISPDGELYVADWSNHRIRKIDRSGVITTVAGTGVSGSTGNGGPALAAQIQEPRGLTFDSAGNLYFTETGRVRRVAKDGTISTIAGNGTTGYGGDGGNPLEAVFYFPSRIAIGPDGAIYVADRANNRIRKIEPGRIVPAGVVNAASNLGGPVAPGEMVTIFGSGIGPASLATMQSRDGKVTNELAGTRFYFDGIPAPVVYAVASQASVIVPYEVANRSLTQFQVEYNGARTNAIALPVASSAPGIFTLNEQRNGPGTGKGPGAILNQDYSLNGPGQEAARGSAIMVYATGEGRTNPPSENGRIADGVYPAPVLPVSATVGGVPASVLFAGTAPGGVAGFFQVNVLIPPNAPTGPAVPIVITVGTASSQPGVTVAIK
jgi:uncharacterized protein (TIGR03437 family)